MTRREHLIHLRETLQICKDANLHIRREKCTFMVTKINTPGFVISHNTLEPDSNKIDMLLKAKTPHNKTLLRAFLSLLQYFRKMLVYLSHICHVLYRLTSPKVKFEWTEVHDNAFQAANYQKESLTQDSTQQKNQKYTLTRAYLQCVEFSHKTKKLLLVLPKHLTKLSKN